MESGRFHTGQRRGNKGQQKSVFSQHLVNKSQNVQKTLQKPKVKTFCRALTGTVKKLQSGKRMFSCWSTSRQQKSTRANKNQCLVNKNSTFGQQKFNVWSTKMQRWINKNSAKSQKMLAELQKNGNLDGRNGKKVKFGWS